MTSYDEMIDELSILCGIAPQYFDIFGQSHITAIETKKAILKAMRRKVDSLEEVKKEIDDLRMKPWKSFMEPVTVISAREQPVTMPIHVPIEAGSERGLSISWVVEDETGDGCKGFISGDRMTVSQERQIDGVRYIKVNLVEISDRGIGYYWVTVACTHPEPIFPGGKTKLEQTSRVIITPDACYMPPQLQQGRAWGLSINLYSIRSGRNWGIGDFTDFKTIVGAIACLKGEFVGINPLHAIPNARPCGISPYSPISRLYRNGIYIDLEDVPEVKESEDTRKLVFDEPFAAELGRLRAEDFIDYEKVMSLKETVLRLAFERFYEREYKGRGCRGERFRGYLSEEGADLEAFATYLAISDFLMEEEERRGGRDTVSGVPAKAARYSWQQWPPEYHNPSGSAVREFRMSRAKQILFYQYVQWIIEEQLRAVALEADNSGMTVGLYQDLAIGSLGGGSDAWGCQDVIAGDVDVGAPPDDFNRNGQNWGFPPIIPEKLKETGYELFIQTIRKNMKYAGALRIDHALGMFRLFWIPRGMSSKEGTYIQYPYDDMLRIIALESVRNRSIVIAEDLGTIGENARETLARFHMLSYRLFYFERNYPIPSFVSPEKYPDMALCAVTTHDLPTLYGYWAARDIEVKKQLGVYRSDSQWQEQLKERERDKGLIIAALRSCNILPDNDTQDPTAMPPMSAEICLAIYQYLGLTPCKLLLVSLDDLTGILDQRNMPGTVDEYPNWRRKTVLTLDEILSGTPLADISTVFEKGLADRERRKMK